MDSEVDNALSENEIRMREYDKKEQEFLHFINQIRRERDAPVTPDQPMPRNLHPKGIQCLLALTRLLEESVKVKMAQISSEKDSEDLMELRKQAERMSHTDHKNFHFESSTHSYTDGDHTNDDLADDSKLFGGSNRIPLDLDNHDSHKTKSLKVGTQMLSGTIGKVKTKFLKTTGSSKDSITSEKKHLSLTPNSSSSNFGQRKIKPIEHDQPLRGISALVHTSSNDLLNLGDVWCGLVKPSTTSRRPGSTSIENSSSSNNEVLAGSSPPSPYHVENDFEKMAFNRQMSEAVTSTQSPTDNQPMDRFVSLPDNLERMSESCTKIGNTKSIKDMNATPPKKGIVSYKTSYEEAILSTRTPPLHPKPQHTSDVGSPPMSSGKRESYQKEAEPPRSGTNAANISKDFAKKFEKWVSKTKHDSKESQSKARHVSNQSKPKGGRRRGKGFNRQRSMSADRAGLLSGQGEADFEEKLRQWGIKQAHDPQYYLSGRQSRVERSVESPGRLSSREEDSTHRNMEKSPERSTTNIEQFVNSNTLMAKARTKATMRVSQSATGLHRPVSIERGRRVSPSRVRRHVSKTSQVSPKSSGDQTSSSMSSSSGSIDPINQLSPSWSIPANQETDLRARSTESLPSTDESFGMEDALPTKSKQSRPLSLLAMPGSLESSDPQSPAPYTTQWSTESPAGPGASSKEVLRTINEDINKIREKKAGKYDSGSSLDKSVSDEVFNKTSDGGNHDRPKFVLDVEVNPSDLPSHSVCVDSGLVMEENHFCDPVLQLHHSREALKTPETSNSEEDSNNDELLQVILDQNSKPEKALGLSGEPHIDLESESFIIVEESDISNDSSKAPSTTTSTTSVKPHEGSTPALGVKRKPAIESEILINTKPLFSKQKAIPQEDMKQSSGHLPDSGKIFVESKLIKIGSGGQSATPQQQSRPNNVSSRERSESSPSNIPSKYQEETNQPLEPLLSSQSVSLKTKLQRLSCLYDYDDGEDLKMKKVEPTGPYDVFKPPKKYHHTRSRSVEGALDVETDFRPPVMKDRSDSEELIGFKANKKPESVNSRTSSSSSPLQVSPVPMRSKPHSKRPVLDLVQKFDAQSSDSSSPLVSPTGPSASSTPQMLKIAERLMQNRANKSHRYTVDLSRHVREIPKEGAVQRARSIFMDMQST